MAKAGTAAAGMAAVALAAALAVVAPAADHHNGSPGSSPALREGADPASDSAGSARGYVWPLSPTPTVLTEFRAPDVLWGAGHRGVDVAAVPGAAVLAAADGVVVFAGWVVDRPVVSIDHPDGIRTTYEPLTAAVQVGEVVTAGQVIGHLAPGVAGTHCVPATCLHWGARVGADAYIDPLSLLGGIPVIRLYGL